MEKEISNAALQKAVEIKGSQLLLAEEVGCNQSTISRALKAKLPAELVLAVEAAVKGQVTRHDLRPDLYPKETSKTNRAQ